MHVDVVATCTTAAGSVDADAEAASAAAVAGQRVESVGQLDLLSASGRFQVSPKQLFHPKPLLPTTPPSLFLSGLSYTHFALG